jgi:hypothetical protein
MRVLDRLSEDDRLAIVERYAAGEGAAVVGKQYGISRNSVMGLVDAAGVPRKRSRPPIQARPLSGQRRSATWFRPHHDLESPQA